MFARLTFTKVLPDYTEQLRKIYNEEVVPVVRQQKGLLHVMLLEPTEKGEEFISVTEWRSRKDAEEYESRGIYEQLVNKINGLAAREPVLKTYTIETVGTRTPEVYG